MLRLIILAAIFSLTAFNCQLPVRLRSFLPPTNEKDLCQSSNKFFYSSLFDFCFTYPNDTWTRIDVSEPLDFPNTSFTTYDFFTRPIEDRRYRIFRLFIAGSGETNEILFQENDIEIGFNEKPYLIGYRLEPAENVPDFVEQRQAEVREMLTSTTIFAELEQD